METIPRRLYKVYKRLRNHFGYCDPWWPGSPLEITLTAILVQQCDWSAAWAGVGRLREKGLLSIPHLAKADLGIVEASIRGVAFARTKAKRLVRLGQALLDRGFEEVEPYLARLYSDNYFSQ
jgi:endonuclease III-like uncharacterized protein